MGRSTIMITLTMTAHSLRATAERQARLIVSELLAVRAGEQVAVVLDPGTGTSVSSCPEPPVLVLGGLPQGLCAKPRLDESSILKYHPAPTSHHGDGPGQ